jgi:mono/diheme cytochrome c family protein
MTPLPTSLLLLAGLSLGTDPPAAAVDYLRDVKPILAGRCYACHAAIKQKGSLRLDTAALIREGGASGPAVLPGNSAKSLLLKHVLGEEKLARMPPEEAGEALKPAQVAAIRKWIEQGATGPKDEKAELDPREHWAFKSPLRPAVPKVRNEGWVKNPIDAFLCREQERHGLVPQSAAEKSILLRRVYLDLIGLPPTREELQAFLSDTAADAYEKVVDQLLTSPQYGERWGRHWMDVWRYSDWWGLGAEMRNSQKHMWHWRDWIVDSLNRDKGYDRMVLEMLAADELFPTDDHALPGTGFLARHYFKFNRTTWLDETIEHTAKAFLGLTMNCAKCHDHKYDPLSQVDYYRFRAFFEPYQVRLDQAPGESDYE